MSCSHSHGDKTFSHQSHVHGPNCGHTAIQHGDHVDYLVDGVLHHPHGDHCDEHVIAIDAKNPEQCSPVGKADEHIHGPGCGHEAIKHGDHIDYIVDGRLQHPHGDHYDDHGPVELVLAD